MLRKKRLNHAQQLLADGHYEKAISLFNRMVADDPSDVDVLERLGELHLRLGVVAKALSAFERAATEFQRAGNLAAALGMLRRIRSTCEEHGPELVSRFGHVAARLGELEQSLAEAPASEAGSAVGTAGATVGEPPAHAAEAGHRVGASVAVPRAESEPPAAPAAGVRPGDAAELDASTDHVGDSAVVASASDHQAHGSRSTHQALAPASRRSSSLTEERPEPSVAAAKALVLQSPWPPRAASSESLLLTRRSDFSNATTDGLKDLQGDPFSLETRLAASSSLLQSGNQEKAAAVLWEGACLLAETQLRQHDVLELLQALRPLRWSADEERLEASVRLEMGGRREAGLALACLQRAFRAEPNHAGTLLMLARTFDCLQEATKATAVLKEGVRIALGAGSLSLGEPLIAELLRRASHDHEVRELAAVFARHREQGLGGQGLEEEALGASLLASIAPAIQDEELVVLDEDDVVFLDGVGPMLDAPEASEQQVLSQSESAAPAAGLSEAGVWPVVAGYGPWNEPELAKAALPIQPITAAPEPRPSQPEI
jgi:tetratricopeptide (TPR) repeat protein